MAGRAGTFIFPWTICSFNCCEVGSGNDGTGRFLVGAFTFIGATIVLLLLAESCYRVATAASATLHRPAAGVPGPLEAEPWFAGFNRENTPTRKRS